MLARGPDPCRGLASQAAIEAPYITVNDLQLATGFGPVGAGSSAWRVVGLSRAWVTKFIPFGNPPT